MSDPFRDRREAGQRLATALGAYAHRSDAIVIGLPRGGVPVASEVARTLDLPLNILLVRKISTLDHPELAIGAVAENGYRVLEPAIIADLSISEKTVERASAVARAELREKAEQFRALLPFPELRDIVAIVVDDGIATGATLRASIAAIRTHEPRRIVVAAPIGSQSTCDALLDVADEVICWKSPEDFFSVSQGYEDFAPTTDQEVIELISAQK